MTKKNAPLGIYKSDGFLLLMNEQTKPFLFCNSLSLIKLIFFIDISGLLGSFRKIFNNFRNVTIDLKGVVGCNNIIASNSEFFGRSINFFC